MQEVPERSAIVMRTLFSAPAPVRMMWEFSTWITLCPRRTRYAPMPIARHVTCTPQTTSSAQPRDHLSGTRSQGEALTMLIVTISSYAWDDSPAIMPEPRRFSTPSPSSFPKMSVMM